MINFGNLTIEEAIERYFEKNDALKRGDLAKLNELKSKHPQIFQDKTTNDIEIVIDYISCLMKNPDFRRRYEAYCREKTKNLLTLI